MYGLLVVGSDVDRPKIQALVIVYNMPQPNLYLNERKWGWGWGWGRAYTVYFRMMQTFSSKQFREALQDPSKITLKLDKYLNQCKQHNINIMYCCLEEIYNILTNTQTPMLKVNAAYALQLFLEMCEYPIVQVIEGCILPVIQDIAFYQSEQRTYSKTSQFFKVKGYPGSIPNLEQLSHNYVTLSTNLIFTAAAIKPTCYFYTEPLTTPSVFKELANKLKERKVEAPADSLSPDWKRKYQANMTLFATTPQYESAYLNFFKAKVQRYLLQGAKGKDPLDFKKLLKNGDSWLTSQLLGCLNQAMEDDNFKVRRLALGLLHEFIINGDIQAVMIVNEGEVVQRIIERFMEVKGSSDLSQGGQIYPQIAGQLEFKKNFYIELLKCIDTWAKLFPKAIYLDREQDSKIARMFRKLKQRQFIFPSNENYPRLYKQFQQNMKKNQERNDYIIKTLNQQDTERPSIASNRMSKYSQKISLIREMRQSTILTVPELEKMIDDTELALVELQVNERLIAKNMKILKYFSQEFEKKFETLEDESISEQKLQNIYVRGSKCLEKVQYVSPIYEDYMNNNITFRQFGKMIAIKCQMVDKSISKISNILSKLTRSKNASRSGLDLSKSVKHSKNARHKEYDKKDHILEKSGYNLDRSGNNLEQVISHNTKTITNMSNLEQDPPFQNRLSSHHSQIVGSKISKSKSSKFKEERSQVSYSQIHNNRRESKNDTAKFIMDEYELKPNKAVQSPRTSNVDYSYSSNRPSFNSDPKSKKEDSINYSNHFKKKSIGSGQASASRNQSRNQSNVSKRQSSKPSAHFREFTSQNKKENFSDCSQWSSSESEQPRVDSSSGKGISAKGRSSKVMESVRSGVKSGSRQVQITQKEATSKGSRQIFNSSSFSKYNQQNQQIRDQIDKQQNPDFRVAFHQKGDISSNNSKISKSLQSHEHYMNVLQSLAPRSILNQRTISKLSKDKTNSLLPHRSQFDVSSRTNIAGNERQQYDNYSKVIPQNQDEYNVQDSNYKRSLLSVPQAKSSSRKESETDKKFEKTIIQSMRSGRKENEFDKKFENTIIENMRMSKSKAKVQVESNSNKREQSIQLQSISNQSGFSQKGQTDKRSSRAVPRTEKSHHHSKVQSSRIRSKDTQKSGHISEHISKKSRANKYMESQINKDATQSYQLKDISHPYLKQTSNHPSKQSSKYIHKQSEPPSSSHRSKKASSQRQSKQSSVSRHSQRSNKIQFVVHKPSQEPMRSSVQSIKSGKSGSQRSSKQQNEYYIIQSPQKIEKQQQTSSHLSNVRQNKIRQIQDLQDRITLLKKQQQHLFIVRNQWQSPARPQNLRSAISPRFRNNITHYSQSFQSFKRPQNQTTNKQVHTTTRTNHTEMDFSSQIIKPPEGKMIYKRLYKKDFAQLDRHEKRKILKGKELVFKNQDIQVGMMIHKNSKDLKIVYYITACRFLKSFLFKIDSNTKMIVHAIPASLSNLQPKKQYRIYLFAELSQFPYSMPKIHFKYHPSLLTIQQNMFECNQVNYFNSIVPFFFTKFFTTREVNPHYMRTQWAKGDIYRGEESRYSRKVIPKHFYVLQYFPNLTNLESTQYEYIYGMEMQYCNTCFLLRIVIKINNFFYIQGVLTNYTDKDNSQRLMEYAITCMTTLLEKSQQREYV